MPRKHPLSAIFNPDAKRGQVFHGAQIGLALRICGWDAGTASVQGSGLMDGGTASVVGTGLIFGGTASDVGCP